MQLNTLTSQGKKRRRLGRGISAGQGKTAGRGTKGQRSRSGKKLRPTFEGGQTPFFQKIPKLKGFKNPNYVEYQVVNVGVLDALGGEINEDTLFLARIIRKKGVPVKILGHGEVTQKLTVSVEKASQSAIDKITKAGGSFVSSLKVLEADKVSDEGRVVRN
jgi:large subunit ribosomal protein L15